MISNDIYQKSDLGREEIKSQSLGVLPREARTLLIMIDGKKTFRNYIDSMDSSKMFAEFGGITPLFELLLEFQCIELVGQSSTTSPPQVPITPRPVEQSVAIEPRSPPTLQTQTSQAQTPQAQRNSEAEFDKAFNNQQPDNIASSSSKRKEPDANYETLKSDLATCIEKNAPAEDAWGYLLNLEQCDNVSQLLALAQNIQSATNANLSRSMSEFLNKNKRQF